MNLDLCSHLDKRDHRQNADCIRIVSAYTKDTEIRQRTYEDQGRRVCGGDLQDPLVAVSRVLSRGRLL